METYEDVEIVGLRRMHIHRILVAMIENILEDMDLDVVCGACFDEIAR